MTGKKYKFLTEPIPITEQIWPKENLPLVSIAVLTYNHENYIKGALESFLIQKTNFQVKIVVFEDCSTDRTAAILRSYEEAYPQLLKVFYMPENTLSFGKKPTFGEAKKPFITEISKAKYIALCDGDDYWTDPLKLQRQMDFLEQNPEFVLVCSGYKKIDTVMNEEKVISKEPIKPSQYLLPNAWEVTDNDKKKSGLTRTSTTFFHSDAVDLEKVIEKYYFFCDVTLFYLLQKSGRVLYMKDVMAVYNFHHSGVYSGVSSLKRNKMAYEVNHEIYKYHPTDDLARYRLMVVCNRMLHFKTRLGLKTYLKCIYYSFKLVKGFKGKEIWLKRFIKSFLNISYVRYRRSNDKIPKA